MAHPDDAELVLGGSIARLIRSGREVVTLCCTAPDEARRHATERASELLGYHLEWLDGGSLMQVEELPHTALVSRIDALVARLNPETLISHWANDSHGDHRLLATACAAATRQAACSLLSVPPSDPRSVAFSRFTPNVYVDVSQTINERREALEFFAPLSERGLYRPINLQYEKCLEAWGAQIGVQYAEVLRGERLLVI